MSCLKHKLDHSDCVDCLRWALELEKKLVAALRERVQVLEEEVAYYKPVYSDRQRLACNFWGSDPYSTIRVQTLKIVTTRKVQFCISHAGEVPAGTRMLVERAVVDGQWGSNYACVECVDQALKESGEYPDKQTT